jgi:hypothetical protein
MLAFCLPPAYLLVLAEIFSSTLKMEAIYSSGVTSKKMILFKKHINSEEVNKQK